MQLLRFYTKGNYFNGVFQNGQNKNLLPVKNEENHLDPGSKKINLGNIQYFCRENVFILDQILCLTCMHFPYFLSVPYSCYQILESECRASEWLLFLIQVSNFSAKSWRQVTFQWDDDACFALDQQHAELDFYSGSSLK